MESRDLDRIRFVTRHFHDLQGLRYAVPLGLITLSAGGLIHFANRPLAYLPAVLFLPALGLLLWARRHYRAYGEVEPQPSDPVPVAIWSPAGPVSRLEDFELVPPIVRHVSIPMGLTLLVFLFLRVWPQVHILIRGDETLGQHPQVLLEIEAWSGYWNGCTMGSPAMLKAGAAQAVHAVFGSFFLGLWLWRERRRSQSHYLVLAVLLLGFSALGTSLGILLLVDREIVGLLDVLLPVLVYPGVALLLCGAAMVLTGLLDHRQFVQALGRPAAKNSRQELGG